MTDRSSVDKNDDNNDDHENPSSLKKSVGVVFHSSHPHKISLDDVPATVLIQDKDGTRTAELDDVKMALFMAMLTYFSTRFVDSVKTIEKKSKKAMEKVLNPDEFVSVLVRPNAVQQKVQIDSNGTEEKKKRKTKTKGTHDSKEPQGNPSKTKHKKHKKTKTESTHGESKEERTEDNKIGDEKKVKSKEGDKKLMEEDPSKDKSVEVEQSKEKVDKTVEVEQSKEKVDATFEKKTDDDKTREDSPVDISDLNSMEIDPKFLKACSGHHARQPSFESEAAAQLGKKANHRLFF